MIFFSQVLPASVERKMPVIPAATPATNIVGKSPSFFGLPRPKLKACSMNGKLAPCVASSGESRGRLRDCPDGLRQTADAPPVPVPPSSRNWFAPAAVRRWS